MADTPNHPSDVPPNAPAKTIEKKVEIKEVAKEKEFKIEVKEHKLEKIEIKEHKDIKIEKLEKNENKEHKDAKVEKLEKNEAKEHKDAKHEKFEHKELKIEQKEIGKLELPEKTIPKEKDGKEIFEGGGFDPGDPIQQRLAALEQNLAGLQHFISTGQRPDLSRGALSREPDKGTSSGGG